MAQVRLTTKGILLVSVIMILFSFALGFGVWKVNGLPNLSPTDSSAGFASCKGKTSKTSCEDTCSPPKGNDKTSYGCTWKNGACKDGNKICSGGSGNPGGFCDGATIGNPSTYKCVLGTDTCETWSGKKTGRYGVCTDISALSCASDWVWSTNTSKCPIETDGSIPPEAGSCGTVVNGCIQAEANVSYNVYTCSGMSYEEGRANGCDTRNGGTVKVVTGKVCPNVSGNFCGWVQADKTGGGPLCFRSWYFPCDDDNPPGDTNKCDGGGILNGATETAEVGETRTIRGYAHDVDGVGTVTILKNNVVVGTANVTDACNMPSDTQATQLCNQYPNSKVVIWTYSYIVEEGTAIYKGVWKDTKGLGGASCEANKTISGTTVVVQDEWEVSKNAGFVCINRDTVSAQVRIDYTITVTNSAEESKNITRIVDTLDGDIDPTWIMTSTINPGATVEGRVITWNLTGDAAIFAAGQTKLYRYSVMLPIGVGGSYDNEAVITPETGDDITVTTTIFASCDVPDTALFDSTISRVVLGAMLLVIGITYLYYEPFSRMINYGFNSVFPTKLDKVDINRRKFERKVVKQ